jgi:homoserine O-succinyltransferase
MPLFIDSGQQSITLNSPKSVVVGLLNNMPDAAIEATERQFIDLLRIASPHLIVILKLFAAKAMPRSAAAERFLDERYCDVSELWDTTLDGLIVTGAEPRGRELVADPFWPTLSVVTDWARDNTASTIWSCLAAHSAVFRSDGIARRALPAKQCGVFEFHVAADHPMTQHFPERLLVPHSRYNGLAQADLSEAGYHILTSSPEIGVDAFAKQDGSFFLFFQGHPEYEADTLLREYRRDVARFLDGEREIYPELPKGYFPGGMQSEAEAFRRRAVAERSAALIAEFPKRVLDAGLSWPWRDAAVGFYEKWIGFLAARKAEPRPPMPGRKPVRRRRTWRDWPIEAYRGAGRGR